MENNSIGLRIKELRHRLGLTQTDLAKLIGVSKQNLYKYENGIITNIPSDKIEAIAHVLHTTPAFLMGWTPTVDFEITDPPAFIQTSGDRKETLANKLYESYLKASPEIQQAVDLLLKADKQD